MRGLAADRIMIKSTPRDFRDFFLISYRYLILTVPDFLQSLFFAMTSHDTMTLPRKRGAVVLGTATIGRHGAHGKDSAA